MNTLQAKPLERLALDRAKMLLSIQGDIDATRTVLDRLKGDQAATPRFHAAQIAMDRHSIALLEKFLAHLLAWRASLLVKTEREFANAELADRGFDKLTADLVYLPDAELQSYLRDKEYVERLIDEAIERDQA